MVKAQVLIGGRGKAGGIKPANTVDEAKKVASAILGMDIRGYKTQDVLIERRLEIVKEMYLGITVDRSNRSLLLMASPSGGMDIESVPEDKILMLPVDPLIGYQPYHGRRVSAFMGLQKEQASQVVSICHRLYELVMKEDAELAEINPLVVTKDGKVVAGGAKVTIDSDALFRHNEYERLHEDFTPLEEKAKRLDIAFVQLDGNIGVIANGAGLTMATLDSLNMYGGEAGVFLDLGGTDAPEKVKSAFCHQSVEGYLILRRSTCRGDVLGWIRRSHQLQQPGNFRSTSRGLVVHRFRIQSCFLHDIGRDFDALEVTTAQRDDETDNLWRAVPCSCVYRNRARAKPV